VHRIEHDSSSPTGRLNIIGESARRDLLPELLEEDVWKDLPQDLFILMHCVPSKGSAFEQMDFTKIKRALTSTMEWLKNIRPPEIKDRFVDYNIWRAIACRHFCHWMRSLGIYRRKKLKKDASATSTRFDNLIKMCLDQWK
jgi:hypothetical protein